VGFCILGDLHKCRIERYDDHDYPFLGRRKVPWILTIFFASKPNLEFIIFTRCTRELDLLVKSRCALRFSDVADFLERGGIESPQRVCANLGRHRQGKSCSSLAPRERNKATGSIKECGEYTSKKTVEEW
jgi:hypothetical protein